MSFFVSLFHLWQLDSNSDTSFSIADLHARIWNNLMFGPFIDGRESSVVLTGLFPSTNMAYVDSSLMCSTIHIHVLKNVVHTNPSQAGRVTIFNDKLVEKNNELRIEEAIQSDKDLTKCLSDKFGIAI